MTIRFEWDPLKARKNEQKHEISFEDAIQVFSEPHALFEQDRCDETGELRWRVLGRAGGEPVLLVAIRFEKSPAAVQIISARQSTRKERKRYEEISDHDSSR